MCQNEEFNIPIESFGDSRSPEKPAYVVYRCGDKIPLELVEELPLELLPDVPSHPSERGRYYADSILFVTLSRYVAEKYCICHKNCAFITTLSLDEALNI